MEKRAQRLENLRDGKDDNGLILDKQQQETESKRLAESQKMHDDFADARDTPQPEKAPPQQQQGSQQVRETQPEPRPVPPPGLDRAGAQSKHNADMARDDAAAKAQHKADLDAFRQREQQVGQDGPSRDTMQNEKDRD